MSKPPRKEKDDFAKGFAARHGIPLGIARQLLMVDDQADGRDIVQSLTAWAKNLPRRR